MGNVNEVIAILTKVHTQSLNSYDTVFVKSLWVTWMRICPSDPHCWELHYPIMEKKLFFSCIWLRIWPQRPSWQLRFDWQKKRAWLNGLSPAHRTAPLPVFKHRGGHRINLMAFFALFYFFLFFVFLLQQTLSRQRPDAGQENKKIHKNTLRECSNFDAALKRILLRRAADWWKILWTYWR